METPGACFGAGRLQPVRQLTEELADQVSLRGRNRPCDTPLPGEDARTTQLRASGRP